MYIQSIDMTSLVCFCSDSQSFNKVAERVLLRLQEKLKGVEEGTVLSVGGQVNLLIQQAMDPKNLSRLFPGWQAWVWHVLVWMQHLPLDTNIAHQRK